MKRYTVGKPSGLYQDEQSILHLEFKNIDFHEDQRIQEWMLLKKSITLLTHHSSRQFHYFCFYIRIFSVYKIINLFFINQMV